MDKDIPSNCSRLRIYNYGFSENLDYFCKEKVQQVSTNSLLFKVALMSSCRTNKTRKKE